ncbi:MAG: RNA polymerase factor sigma-54 [Acidaminococcales bacterium]|jgi:RNA polymerase sigma-54 factor|nr:RNA polymerase factor sigma-54 [Acidaminococcales bacterium]
MSILKLEISQKLNMTQQLVQAVAILAMSGQELTELLNKEVLENPVLEFADSAPAQLEERWPQGYSQNSQAGETLYSLARQNISLQDYLTQQIALNVKTAAEKAIAEYIIGSLNTSGYLEQPLDRIAEKFNTTRQAVNNVRKAIQDMEPPGFASLNIAEFLLLQLNKKADCAEVILAKAIVREHLAALAQRDFESIAMATGSSLPAVTAAVGVIKQLNPRPVNGWLEDAETQYITPDIIIRKTENKFVVFLNPIYLRTLRIQDEYALLRKNVDKETRKYINKNLRSAQWIIQCLEQREKTLRKISEIIVELQHGFLESGFIHLRPLTLREVARIAAVHESTVSRAISGKYAQTPHGSIPLKAFFPAGINTNSGHKINFAQIKKRIAEIAKSETGISDKKMADLLAQEGIMIARRTVAKYRETLGIEPSFVRKKQT